MLTIEIEKSLNQKNIAELLHKQQAFFRSGKTRELAYRIHQLRALQALITENDDKIIEAINSDFQKPVMEAYVTEVGLACSEIRHALKNIRKWVKPRRVGTSLANFPAWSSVYPEPYGLSLIIGAWNYPFQLVAVPLIASIAAGNCTVLKPSESAPRTSRLIATLISRYFDSSYIAVLEGNAELAEQLVEQPFDHIFYTGGSAVGKKILAAAAGNLVPVTLELGGKNPCIVESDIHAAYAAKRIVWGKFYNAGQTCVAPDYLLVNKAVKKELVRLITLAIQDFYGSDPAASSSYGRIVNQRHFSRLVSCLEEGDISWGGATDARTRFIAPTIIENPPPRGRLMTEEIFGPILPVIEYDSLDHAIRIVNERPKPLALYFFSRDKNKQRRITAETSAGSICFNGTMSQFISKTLPFGGVGMSGMGSYHGYAGFRTFSHEKSILRRTFLVDSVISYPPHRVPLSVLKKIIRFFL